MASLCIMALLMSGCAQEEDDDTIYACGYEEACTEADKSDYENLEDDHVFLETTYAQAIEILQDETFSGILYFGYPSCPWCAEAVVYMNEAAKEVGQSIYYINKKSDDSLENSELEDEIVEILIQSIDLDEDDEGNPHLYVPEVIVIQDGVIVSHHNGTVEGHDAHERTMSE